MKPEKIELDFGTFILEAELFDNNTAQRFAELLPININLTQWGEEVYGPVGIDLGEDKPITEIPAGGIAYSRNGSYLCLFFGQKSAWAVDYIGRVKDDGWKMLAKNPNCTSVRKKASCPNAAQ